jgi:uroporphyrin-3 C-methyltransferase
MNDTQTATIPVARRPSRLFRYLFLGLLIGGTVLAAYVLHRMRAGIEEAQHQIEPELSVIEREQTLQQGQLNDIEGHVADINQSSHDHGDQIATLQGRMDNAEQSLSHVQTTVQGGRIRMQLLTVEQLLLAANDAAQLENDAHAAGAALKLADDRLGTLADPQLFAVRKVLAEERAAVDAVPQVDLSGAALTLGAMIERAGKLPLRAGAPDRFRAVPAAPPPTDHPLPWHKRFWRSVHDALNALFTIRRTDQAVSTLLPQEQQELIGEVLSLRLESARTALLKRDTPVFRDALASSAHWLDAYYRLDDPGVLSMQATIEQLQSAELRPAVPDLSRSLALLRAYLDRQ